MRLVTAVLKVFGSSAVLGAAVWFLLTFGPRPTPAHADIYTRVATTAGFLIPPTRGASSVSEPRALKVNGQGFHYVVSHTEQPLAAVLDQYERGFVAENRASGARASTAARIEGPAMGIVSGFRLGVLRDNEDLGRRVASLARTKRLADLGQFSMVVAFAQAGTVCLQFAPDPDAKLDALLPPGDADAAGDDVPGLGHPDGLQRLFTVDQEAKGDLTPRTVVYRVRGDRTPALRWYETRLRAAGFELQTLDPTPARTVVHGSRSQEDVFVVSLEQEGLALLAVVFRGRV